MDVSKIVAGKSRANRANVREASLSRRRLNTRVIFKKAQTYPTECKPTKRSQMGIYIARPFPLVSIEDKAPQFCEDPEDDTDPVEVEEC